ncbi:F0F1 ATP synthase subunit I [Candidatus Sororendozoicomonas aggregata]|uniref:F0F1 ATP synthase subunit I n=1 Tax=Candidatus Sororendozoicomonas aggregata TaxID=3073239 RepID=UPI002ED28B31
MQLKVGLYSGHDYLQKPAVHKVVLTQFSVTLVLMLLSLPISFNAALSALLGGLCCAIPHAYLVWRAFRFRGARAAKQIVSSFYQGEIGKFILTVVAFVLVFTLNKSVEPWALFGAFFITQSTNWLTPLLLAQRQRKHSH